MKSNRKKRGEKKAISPPYGPTTMYEIGRCLSQKSVKNRPTLRYECYLSPITAVRYSCIYACCPPKIPIRTMHKDTCLPLLRYRVEGGRRW